MDSIESISSAIQLIDEKKQNLKKAFEHLQAQTQAQSSSTFSLTWSDLDTHFSTLHSSLLHKFNLLQNQSQITKNPSDSSKITKNPSDPAALTPFRFKLKSFCEKSDGLGLRNYLVKKYMNQQMPKARASIRAQVSDTLFRFSPDPGTLFLTAMDGFFNDPNNENRDDVDLISVRAVCLVFLEELVKGKMVIGGEVKERAKKLAVEWKGKMGNDGVEDEVVLGFLNLVAAYGLVEDDEFSVDEIVGYLADVAYCQSSVELCRALFPTADKMSDIIQKIIDKGELLPAVKFIFEFELTDKFPPVPLLKEYVKEVNKLALKGGESEKLSSQSLSRATVNEVNVLKSVIKCIKAPDFETVYLKAIIEKRIEDLENGKADCKLRVTAPTPNPQKQSTPQKLSGSKHQTSTPSTASPP